MHTTLLLLVSIIILRCLTTECQTESSTERESRFLVSTSYDILKRSHHTRGHMIVTHYTLIAAGLQGAGLSCNALLDRKGLR